MRYFDAHCHVQFSQYDEDRHSVLAAMEQEGVGALIVGTDRESSARAVSLADGRSLFASVGLHPNDKPGEGYDDTYYEALARDPNVVAIGECGLDYFRPEEPGQEKARQRDAFVRQIQLAGTVGKPLVIHARPSKGSMDAYLDALSLLEEARRTYPALRGDFHFFVGTPEIAERIVALNFTCSFTAVITFARDYDETIRALPLSAILAETDAPYVAPAPLRGTRNVPLAVQDVVTTLARIRGQEEEEVRKAVLHNAQELFGLNAKG